MLTDERRAEIEALIAFWEADQTGRDLAPTESNTEGMGAIEAFEEVAHLKELLASRSELAATTIAGLEREVASLQISLKVHVDGERRLRAEVFRLRAERESNERRC
jgi:hypothetical protein